MLKTATEYLEAYRGFTDKQGAIYRAVAALQGEEERLKDIIDAQQTKIAAAREHLADITNGAYDAYWGHTPMISVNQCRATTDTGVGDIILDLVVGQEPIKVSGKDWIADDRRRQRVRSLYIGKKGSWDCVLVLYDRNLFPSENGDIYFDAHMTLVK